MGNWDFVKEESIGKESGLFIGVFKRKNSDGTVDYVVVNKGSSTTNDWIQNLLQPFGASSDMYASIFFAKQFVKNHPDAHITFVGHSKGGGEALTNAKATNKNAIVFNPAIPNYKKYGLGNTAYTAKATSYVVVGEALSLAYSLAEATALSPYTPMTPWLLDDFIALASRKVFESKPFWKTEWLENKNGWSPIKDHLMEEVID